MPRPKKWEVSEEKTQYLFEEYGERFDEVTEAYPDFDNNDKIRMGVLLENINDAFDKRFNNMLNEDATMSAPNVINGIKTQYFDIVEAVFPNLIADQIFTVQPIQQRVGEIFFQRFVYGNNKGSIKRGDTIFGANEIAGYENSFYTQDHIDGEAPEKPTAGNTYETSLQNYPVAMGSVNLTIGDKVYEDDGQGNLVDSTTGKRAGSIDYGTGAITAYGKFTADQEVSVDYDATFEAKPDTIPSLELVVDSTFVQARPRKLRGTYTLDAGYDLKQSQGIDIRDALLQAAAMQLKNEVDGELIKTAYDQAGTKVTFTANYNVDNPYISKKDYYELFVEHIFQQCSRIRQITKRVTGNFIVCGKRAGDILQFIGAPRFIGVGTGVGEVGPYYAGMLDNRIKVYIDPFLGEMQYLIGYKGNNLIDAGLIYAPYLLFFATETVMLDDFLGRRGFSTSYAKKMINKNMYVAGTIIEPEKPVTPGSTGTNPSSNP